MLYQLSYWGYAVARLNVPIKPRKARSERNLVAIIAQAIETPLVFIIVVSIVLPLMGLVFEALSMVLIMARTDARHNHGLAEDKPRDPMLMDFVELRRRIGFDTYYQASSAYKSSFRSSWARLPGK